MGFQIKNKLFAILITGSLVCPFFNMTLAFAEKSSLGISSYNWSGGFRNYPSGFSVGAEAKLSQFLWDKRQSSQSPIYYGLLQENLNIATHGLIGWNLSFYPISFVRLSVGQNYVSKYYNINTLPCNSIACKGNLKRDTVSLAFALGYDHFVFSPQWTQVWLKPQGQITPFGSEEDYLVGAINGDKINTQQFLFGYKYQESLFGLLIKYSKTDIYHNDSLSRYFVAQHPVQVAALSNQPLKLYLGAGLFSSTWVETPQFSALIGIKGGSADDPALF